MKTWDVIVIGGGVIGLSLARRLRIEHRTVLVIEKHEPATEATAAAGGMLADCDPHTPPALVPLAHASAEMYPDFVAELEQDSGESADLRDTGTIAWFEGDAQPACAAAQRLSDSDLRCLEPLLRPQDGAWFLPERSLDPRGLGRALRKSTKRLGLDLVTGSPVLEVLATDGRAAGVRTSHSSYFGQVVVNCAGAWASQVQPVAIPTRPVKGQMVCLVPNSAGPQSGPLVQRVIRTPDIYIIPRSDGRILLGATVEDVGFDKRVDPNVISRLYQAGTNVAPALSAMRIHDAWAGLRPGTPDNLPILGETSLPGYYAATGHFRDGILLAPASAEVMTQLILGQRPAFDLDPFSPLRF